MRYHYEKPTIYLSMYGKRYICNHPVYDSYKVMVQASGRIDRLTTPFSDLYYFHLKSFSGIDLAISKALKEKKNFNEGRFVGWSTAPMPKAA